MGNWEMGSWKWKAGKLNSGHWEMESWKVENWEMEQRNTGKPNNGILEDGKPENGIVEYWKWNTGNGIATYWGTECQDSEDGTRGYEHLGGTCDTTNVSTDKRKLGNGKWETGHAQITQWA